MSNILKITRRPTSAKSVSPNDEREKQKNEEVDRSAEIAAERERLRKLELEKRFQAGYEKGIREATLKTEEKLNAEWGARLERKNEEFARITADFEQKLGEYDSAFEQVVTTVSMKAAEKIVMSELANRSVIEQIIRGSMKKVIGANDVMIKIHPADFEILKDGSLLNAFSDTFTKIKFEVNDKISQGGCYIETDIGNVDARIETQLAEMTKLFENSYLTE